MTISQCLIFEFSQYCQAKQKLIMIFLWADEVLIFVLIFLIVLLTIY